MNWAAAGVTVVVIFGLLTWAGAFAYAEEGESDKASFCFFAAVTLTALFAGWLTS